MKVTSHPDKIGGVIDFNSVTMSDEEAMHSVISMSAYMIDVNSERCSLSLNFISTDESSMNIVSTFTINDFIVSDTLHSAVSKFITSYNECGVFRNFNISDSIYVCDTLGNEVPSLSAQKLMEDAISGENKLTSEFLFSNLGTRPYKIPAKETSKCETRAFTPKLRK